MNYCWLAIASALVLLFGCGIWASTRPAQSPADSDATAAQTSAAPTSALGGPIESVAGDGSAITQHGSHVNVFDPSWRNPAQLPLGKESDVYSTRYAVSRGGRYVGYVDASGWIQLWDARTAERLQRLDPGQHFRAGFDMPMVGAAPETTSSWGAPTFLGDDTLVTHHGDGAILWNVPSGTFRCKVEHPSAVYLARETFAFGDDRALLRSGSDSASFANAAMVEFRTDNCQIEEFHLVKPDSIVGAVASGSERFIFAGSTIRRLTTQGTFEVAGTIATAAPSLDAERQLLAWSTDQSVMLWDWRNNRQFVVAELPRGVRLAHLAITTDEIVALQQDGVVCSWPIPTDGGQSIAVRSLSAIDLAREQFVILLGLGERARALALLEGTLANEQGAPFVGAYVRSLDREISAAAFRGELRRANIQYRGDASILGWAEAFGNAQLTSGALDLYLYWLEAPTTGRDDAAVELGFELSLQLGAIGSEESHELRNLLFARMRRVFPNNAELAERIQELAEIESDEEK